jgi:hypothetical protein
MKIKTFAQYQRLITIFVLPFLLLLLLHTPAAARVEGNEEARSSNVKWSMKDNVIIINYDLIGSVDNKYLIEVVMKNDKDPSFSVIPKSVEGDVGEGMFSGSNREIRWYYQQDYPRGFEGGGYYFEIHVNPVSQQSNLLYYILGAAALTGGAIALLLGKGQGPTSGSHELPMPPSRP